MKKLLFSAILAVLIPSLATASPLDNIQIPSGKGDVVNLNGEWSFMFINSNDWSAYNNFFCEGFDYSSWDRIPVPGCWDALGYLPAKYAHPEDVTGLYITTFDIPKNWKGKKVFLNFDGVLRAYELWINGNYAGKWELANNSCQFDITPLIKKGKNELALRVYTRYKGYEFDGNDDWGPVGIHRDVTLFAVPQTHVRDLDIITKVAEDSSAEVRLDIALNGVKEGKTVVKGEILCPHMGVKDSFEYKVDGDSVSHIWKVARPHLWTAETPSLYTLQYSVWQNGRKIESFTRKFGIREVRIEGDRLLLNNRLFKLRGVTAHATDPRTGKVISDELNLKDMKLMKEANVNFIRTSHYPREPRFYDLCDSLGFYVMDEVPFGYGDEHLRDSSYQDNLILRAQATVVRDKNHPSVIIWSIGNENDLTPICQVTGKYVQKMDPTRPICFPMIGSYFNRFNFDLPDFLDIYAPHYPSANTLRSYAKQSRKPLIATEYCHTLGQALEDHHSMWEVMQANDNLAGGAIWEWVDQGMPDRESRWQGRFEWTDRVWLSETDVIKMEGNQGTDGLLYPTRDPLPNYYNIRKNYAQAYVLTDNLCPDASHSILAVELENRYDFVNLKDRIECKWEIKLADGTVLSSAVVSPDCEPHGRCTVTIDAEPALKYLDSRFCTLELYFTDKTNGLAVNEKSFILNSDEQYRSIISSLQQGAESAKPLDSYIFGSPFWRSGRKPSIAEDLILTKRGGEYVKNYILGGVIRQDTGECRFINDEIGFSGHLKINDSGNGVSYGFDMKTGTSGKLLTEAGLAFLIDANLDCFQWVGRGPYTSYPGKDDANHLGVHALKAGDLYFEGNKMGVDALLCTDEKGNGVLFISDVSNVNFEETDKGILVSFNPVVSGMGRKGQVTMFPQYSQNIGQLQGSVTAIPVEAGKWSEAMKQTFKDPASVGKYSPFISVYDTYLRKFEDIIQERDICPLKHYDFIYAGEWDTRKPDCQSLFIVQNGKVTLQHSIPLHDEWGRIQEFDDIKLMSDGNIAYAAMSQIGILSPSGEQVWKYICPQGTESHSCQPLDNERLYFAANGNPAKIVIFNWKEEKVEKEIIIPTSVTNTHAQLRHVRITPEGNFTVGLMGERKILEISPDGNVVNTIDNVKAWHVEKMSNGNYLVAGDNTCCVKELDKNGNTVWEVTQKDIPFKLHCIQTAQRLPNGNTIFNDWIAGQDESTWAGTVQFYEVTPDKEIVWMLSSWEDPDLGPSTALEIIK